MQIWQFLTLEHWMKIFLDASAAQRTDEFATEEVRISALNSTPEAATA